MGLKIISDNNYIATVKVVGIGGAGGNAINNMIEKGMENIEFIALNTDIQDLERSKAETKLQIGRSITYGLGAGMDETKGAKAIEENRKEIRQLLKGCDMVFIIAGMGGGTGTGGAPAFAKIAKENGALVVAIVTKPFDFEGDDRHRIAEEGIKRLKQEVDSCIIIPNERLLTVFGEEVTLENSFRKVDDVLYNTTRGIADIITRKGKVNIDFADIKTIMRDMGDALLGIGYAKGENKALRATQEAIDNPLLEGVSIKGSKSILLNVIADPNFKISDLKNMTELIKKAIGSNYSKLIWGVVSDERLEDEVIVSLILSGVPKQIKLNLSESIISRIKDHLAIKNISVYKLCKDCNIPQGTFSQIAQGKYNFRIEHLMAISKYLNVSIDYLVSGNEFEYSKGSLSQNRRIVSIPSQQENYSFPSVHSNNLLSADDLMKIRSRNQELDIEDFDFDSDEFKISNDDKPTFIRKEKE